MPSLHTILMASIAALLATAPIVSAVPSPQDDVRVYIRNPDFSYDLSPNMAQEIQARNVSPLTKRSHATVEACPS